MNTNYHPVPCHGRGWVSLAIRSFSLFGFVFVAAALIVAMIILTVLSNRNNGFVAVHGEDIAALGFRFDLAATWTTLPNFIFRLTTLYWDAIVAAFIDRQPYVELSKPHKKNAARISKSIALDYRTSWLPFRWIAAFKNRHVLIGCSVLLGIVFSVFISPLSASLLVPRTSLKQSTTSVSVVSRYDESQLDAGTDWKPVYDRVATVVLYNAEPYPWTDAEHAFPAFSVPSTAATGLSTSSYTVDVNGTSAYLDCRIINDVESSFTESSVAGGVKVSVAGSDRGCDFEQEYTVSDQNQVYLKTTTTRFCPAEAYYSRLVFSAGHGRNSSSGLSNFTVISCLTGYATTQGKLTFSPASNSSGLKFEKTSEPYIRRQQYADVFEADMFLSTDFSLNSAWLASDFGSMVLYLTQQQHQDFFLTPEYLMESIKKVFTSTYLMATAMNSYVELDSPESIKAIRSEPQLRLHVVIWVAAVLILVLLLCIICTICIWNNVRSNSTILTEEPQGLLSAAGILHGSNLPGMVWEVCSSQRYNGKFLETLEQSYDLKESTCVATAKENYAPPVVEVLDLRPRRVGKQDGL